MKRRATDQKVEDGMQASADVLSKLILASGISAESVKPEADRLWFRGGLAVLCGFTQSGGSGISGSFAGGKITGAVNFGFGSQAQTFGATAAYAVASSERRRSWQSCPVSLHLSIVVHGSGECDQLDLGDDMRERKEPTLSKSLNRAKH